MSHPDPDGPAATRPWRIGDELDNPVTKEHARILEAAWQNPQGRARAEMIARVGARVLGEHLHPGLVERFTVLEGELTVRRDGKLGKLLEGQTGEVRAGQWHDWWNATTDARVMVEVEPGEGALCSRPVRLGARHVTQGNAEPPRWRYREGVLRHVRFRSPHRRQKACSRRSRDRHAWARG